MTRSMMPLLLLGSAFLAAAAPAMPPSGPMTLGEGTARLHGSFVAPAEPSAGAEPVLILAGSGPTDRDGNSPIGVRAAPYRLLAEGLAAKGIASLRVDKRGIAGSGAAAAREEDLRIDTYAEDAKAWTAALKRATGARCVWLAGHSEGTLHALIAAQSNPDLCGLLLISPVGRKMADVIREQLRANPANAPFLAEALSILASLEAGQTVPGEGMNPVLVPLFRPSVQPFLMSMLRVDPAALAKSYEGPVLVIQGSTDLQTTLADAELLGAARPGIEVRVIEGMNHVLKSASADRAVNMAAYANPDLPLAPGLVDLIADFIRKH